MYSSPLEEFGKHGLCEGAWVNIPHPQCRVLRHSSVGGEWEGESCDTNWYHLLTFEGASWEGFQSRYDYRRECSYQPLASSDLCHLSHRKKKPSQETTHLIIHSMSSKYRWSGVLMMPITCSIDHCIYSSRHGVVFSQCCLTGLNWETHTLKWERERECIHKAHTWVYTTLPVVVLAERPPVAPRPLCNRVLAPVPE